MEIAVFRWHLITRMGITVAFVVATWIMLGIGGLCARDGNLLPAIGFLLGAITAIHHLVGPWTNLYVGIGPEGIDIPRWWTLSVLPPCRVSFDEIARIGTHSAPAMRLGRLLHHQQAVTTLVIQTKAGVEHSLLVSLYDRPIELIEELRHRIELPWEALEHSWITGNIYFPERL